MEDKKRILITGANGQLGKSLNAISKNYDYKYFFKNKHELDITNVYLIKKFLKDNQINTIINCAAYTDVTAAENNMELANNINNDAVDYLAKFCFELKIQLIHISTDYVFDGKKENPYSENHQTNPLNFYGISKLKGEQSILKYNLDKSVIIRTSWVYSKYGNNFVNKILNKINNQKKIFVYDYEYGSPTNSHDLAKIIFKIIQKLKGKTSIFHFSNEGYCSRYQFALKINELTGNRSKIVPTNIYQNNILRPKFTALNSEKISSFLGIGKKHWSESLENHLKNYIKKINYEA